MSQKPMLIYGLASIVNPSFEDDSTPTGWDTSLSVNGDSSVTATEFHSPGSSNPSIQSLRLNVATASTSNKAIVRQRFQLTDLFSVLNRHEGFLVAASMVKFSNSLSKKSSSIRLYQYSGGTATIGSGTPLASAMEQESYYGTDDWVLGVFKAQIHADVEWVEVSVEYALADTADYGVTNYTYWDRVFLGGLIDFPPGKGVNKWNYSPVMGYKVNEGDGEYEIVKIRRARTKFEMRVEKVLAGTDIDRDLKAFQEHLASGSPGSLAVWGNRSQHDHAGRHYSSVYVDPTTPSYQYPPGVERRDYKYKFIAPMEHA